MSHSLETVMEDRTAGTVHRLHAQSTCMNQPVAARGLVFLGNVTGASALGPCLGINDWTSGHVVELQPPLSWPVNIQLNQLEPSNTPIADKLQQVKERSSLTWGQIAEAMNVAPRALHLWRRGGGISASNEERLHELKALVDSVDTGATADVRIEFVEAGPSGSLLARLREGAAPDELIRAAPWRSRTNEEVVRNVDARRRGEPIDEDYLFLVYLSDDQVREFSTRAAHLLTAPHATRSEWNAMIDAEFARIEQPLVVTVEGDGDDLAAESEGITPLFDPSELGVPLGVGAIASRLPLSNGQ